MTGMTSSHSPSITVSVPVTSYSSPALSISSITLVTGSASDFPEPIGNIDRENNMTTTSSVKDVSGRVHTQLRGKRGKEDAACTIGVKIGRAEVGTSVTEAIRWPTSDAT